MLSEAEPARKGDLPFEPWRANPPPRKSVENAEGNPPPLYNPTKKCYYPINGIYTSTCSRYLLKEERTCNGLFFLPGQKLPETSK